MDYESIKRLQLDFIDNIDIESCEEIYNPANANHIIKIELIKDMGSYCPYCGVVGKYKLRSTTTQEIKHASSTEDNITIKLSRRVFECECGKTFKEPNPFTNTKQKITLSKELKVLNDLKDINKSFKAIAIEHGISITSVINIFDSRVDIPRQKLPTVLCVDEVYSKHCGFNKYCFVTFSPQLNKVLDILPSRNKEDLCGYFGNIPLEERNQVKYFSMDLYETYRQVAKLCFPNALICADHFHVIKNLTDHFNKARIRIMKKFEKQYNKGNWYWLYKKYWKLLLKAPGKLKFKKFTVSRSGMELDEHQIVNYMLTLDEDLKAGYELLNEYRGFNDIATTDDAAKRLDELIIKYHNSTLPEYAKSYKLLKNWRDEIINSFNRINDHVISNGGMERANRDIKTIIRNAYGYKNFMRLRNRIMYILNQDASILNRRKK